MDSPLTGGSVSASFGCTSIARATEISVSTAKVNPGNTFSLTLSPASTAFSHSVTASLGSEKIEKSVAAGVTSVSISVPQNWANEVTTSKNAAVSLVLTTKNGSSEVGTKKGSITLEIPETEEYLPSFEVNVLPVSDTVPGEWGAYVKGKGNVRVEITDEAYRFGATRSSVTVTAFGVTKRELQTEIPLTKSGSNKISVALRDSRGFSKTKEFYIDVADYSPPSLNFTALYRCKSDGTADKSGTYLAAEFLKSFSDVDGKNSAAVTLMYKKSGSESYSKLENVQSPAVFGEGAILLGASYDVKLLCEDLISESPTNAVRRISSADIPFNIRRGGTGASFGCYAETDGELTVAYDLNVLGSIKTDEIASKLELTDYADAVIGRIKLSKALGIAIFNLRFTLKKAVPKNTEVTLGTLAEVAPVCLNPLAVRAYYSGSDYDSAHCRAFLTYKSELRVKCSEILQEGSWVYISGAVNNIKEDE